MPNLNKIRKKSKTKKLTNLPVKTKTTKASSPVDYYNCLLTQAQNDWRDSAGQKKKITSCCKDCKVNAPVLNRQRQQEINKLVVSYHQVGESLKKLLKPLK
jgi:hypothetical protein